ncbi:MAG: hypothetical protein PHI60_08200 [Candidatus Omnitrophica bacterium]|nr:hypothetical protein [Candidatus Omnitrophota bacterium]
MSQNEELSLEIDRILTNELNLGLELREMIRAATSASDPELRGSAQKVWNEFIRDVVNFIDREFKKGADWGYPILAYFGTPDNAGLKALLKKMLEADDDFFYDIYLFLSSIRHLKVLHGELLKAGDSQDAELLEYTQGVFERFSVMNASVVELSLFKDEYDAAVHSYINFTNFYSLEKLRAGLERGASSALNIYNEIQPLLRDADENVSAEAKELFVKLFPKNGRTHNLRPVLQLAAGIATLFAPGAGAGFLRVARETYNANLKYIREINGNKGPPALKQKISAWLRPVACGISAAYIKWFISDEAKDRLSSGTITSITTHESQPTEIKGLLAQYRQFTQRSFTVRLKKLFKIFLVCGFAPLGMIMAAPGPRREEGDAEKRFLEGARQARIALQRKDYQFALEIIRSLGSWKRYFSGASFDELFKLNGLIPDYNKELKNALSQALRQLLRVKDQAEIGNPVPLASIIFANCFLSNVFRTCPCRLSRQDVVNLLMDAGLKVPFLKEEPTSQTAVPFYLKFLLNALKKDYLRSDANTFIAYYDTAGALLAFDILPKSNLRHILVYMVYGANWQWHSKILDSAGPIRLKTAEGGLLTYKIVQLETIIGAIKETDLVAGLPDQMDAIRKRIALIEGYAAPLSASGRSTLDEIKRKAAGKMSAEEQEKVLATLNNPPFAWFETYFERIEKEKALKMVLKSKSPLEMIVTKGCSVQCDYCIRASEALKGPYYMPWPWIKELIGFNGELKSLIEKKTQDAFSYRDEEAKIIRTWFDNDPLRDYYDPLYDKDYADIILEIIKNGSISQDGFYIPTSGWEIGSIGERAMRKLIDIRSENPHILFLIKFNISTEKEWSRKLGRDEYIRHMKAAYALARRIRCSIETGELDKFTYWSTGAFDAQLIKEIVGEGVDDHLLEILSKTHKPKKAGKAAKYSKEESCEYTDKEDWILFRPDRDIEKFKQYAEAGKGLITRESLLPVLSKQGKRRIKIIGHLPKPIQRPLLKALRPMRFNVNSPVELLTLMTKEELLRVGKGLRLGEGAIRELEEILSKEGLSLGVSLPEGPSYEIRITGSASVPGINEFSALIQGEIDHFKKLLILRDKEVLTLIKGFLQAVIQDIKDTNTLSDEEAMETANYALKNDTNTLRSAQGRETWRFVKGKGVMVEGKDEIISKEIFFSTALGNLVSGITGNLGVVSADPFAQPKLLADELMQLIDSIMTYLAYVRALEICYPVRGLGPGTYEFSGEIISDGGITSRTLESAGFDAHKRSRVLEALTKIRKFNVHNRDFSFERLQEKIKGLLLYEGKSKELARRAVYNALINMGKAASKGDAGISQILGLAGELSGVYEVVINRGNTLEKISLGDLEAINHIVYDDNAAKKEFDAVSTNTVFEFKFHLTLRKLYQQVIGIDSAHLPHLKVLEMYPERFSNIRNIVYFGEAESGYVVKAITAFLNSLSRERRADIVKRITITRNKGVSIKLTLAETAEFLCAGSTMDFVIEEGRRHGNAFPVRDFARIRNCVREAIGTKIRQLREGEKFDVIIGVSRTSPQNIEGISGVKSSSAAEAGEASLLLTKPDNTVFLSAMQKDRFTRDGLYTFKDIIASIMAEPFSRAAAMAEEETLNEANSIKRSIPGYEGFEIRDIIKRMAKTPETWEDVLIQDLIALKNLREFYERKKYLEEASRQELINETYNHEVLMRAWNIVSSRAAQESKLRTALEHEEAGIAASKTGDYAYEIAAYRLALNHLPQGGNFAAYRQRIESRLKNAIESARLRNQGKGKMNGNTRGQGGIGNLDDNQAEEIKGLISQNKRRLLPAARKLIDLFDGVPVNVYFLTSQITRAPPKGFIWEQIKDGELHIYFSSLTCYKQYAQIPSALNFFSCHGTIEISTMMQGVSPGQAHTIAWEKAAQRYPQAAREIKALLKKRVWREDGRIRVSQHSYIARKTRDVTRYVLSEGAATHRTMWEAFRAEDHRIDSELEDRIKCIRNMGLISQAVRSLEGQKSPLKEEERGKVIEIVREMSASMVKPAGRPKISEKIISQILSITAQELIDTVQEPRHEAIELLKNIHENLKLRKEGAERIIAGRRIALKELREMSRSTNMDISRRAEAAAKLAQSGELNKAKGQILGITRLGIIKGEPEYSPVKRLLFAASGAKDEKRVSAVLDMVKQKLREIEFLYEFMIKYRDDLLSKELKEDAPVDKQQLLKETFVFFWKTANSEFADLLNRSLKQRAIWWAKVYRAICISLNINDPENRSQRIPNPVFLGIARYIRLLEYNFIEDLLGKRDIGAKVRDILKEAQSEKRKSGNVIRKENELKTYIVQDDLDGLAEAISQDLKLNPGKERQDLRGCVWKEDRPRPQQSATNVKTLPGPPAENVGEKAGENKEPQTELRHIRSVLGSGLFRQRSPEELAYIERDNYERFMREVRMNWVYHNAKNYILEYAREMNEYEKTASKISAYEKKTPKRKRKIRGQIWFLLKWAAEGRHFTKIQSERLARLVPAPEPVPQDSKPAFEPRQLSFDLGQIKFGVAEGNINGKKVNFLADGTGMTDNLWIPPVHSGFSVFQGDLERFIRMTPEKFTALILGLLAGKALTLKQKEEIGAFCSAIKEIYGLRENYLFEGHYPYICDSYARSTAEILQKHGLKAREQDRSWPELKRVLTDPADDPEHHFVRCRIAGYNFIVDITADQFEREDEKGKYQQLGIVVLPVQEARKDPARFWMYNRKLSDSFSVVPPGERPDALGQFAEFLRIFEEEKREALADILWPAVKAKDKKKEVFNREDQGRISRLKYALAELKAEKIKVLSVKEKYPFDITDSKLTFVADMVLDGNKGRYFIKTRRTWTNEPEDDACKVLEELCLPNSATVVVRDYFVSKYVGDADLTWVSAEQMKNREFRRGLCFELGRASAAAYIIGLADRSPTNIRICMARDKKCVLAINTDLTTAFQLLELPSEVGEQCIILSFLFNLSKEAGLEKEEFRWIIRYFIEGFCQQYSTTGKYYLKNSGKIDNWLSNLKYYPLVKKRLLLQEEKISGLSQEIENKFKQDYCRDPELIGDAEDMKLEVLIRMTVEKAENLGMPLTRFDELLIRGTGQLVKEAHKDQKRKSGEPYFNHQLEVATEANNFDLSEFIINGLYTLMTNIALFHDTREDQGKSYREIKHGIERRLEETKLHRTGEKEALRAYNLLRLGVAMLSKLEGGEWRWIPSTLGTRPDVSCEPEDGITPEELTPPARKIEGKGGLWVWQDMSPGEIKAEYYRRLVNPRSLFNKHILFPESNRYADYSDLFIRMIQVIKLADRIANFRDLASLFKAGMDITESKAFVEKVFNETAEYFLPAFVESSQHLTFTEKINFYTILTEIIDGYIKNEDPAAKCLKDAAADFRLKIEVVIPGQAEGTLYYPAARRDFKTVAYWLDVFTGISTVILADPLVFPRRLRARGTG